MIKENSQYLIFTYKHASQSAHFKETNGWVPQVKSISSKHSKEYWEEEWSLKWISISENNNTLEWEEMVIMVKWATHVHEQGISFEKVPLPVSTQIMPSAAEHSTVKH